MKSELIMINEKMTEETSVHHLFTRPEIRKAIVRIIGKPDTDQEHLFLQSEVKKAWNKIPQYIISNDNHNELHKDKIDVLDLKEVLTKPKLGELIRGGIKSFENEKGEVIKNKPSLEKRIVGQIFGYINNFEHDNFMEQDAISTDCVDGGKNESKR